MNYLIVVVLIFLAILFANTGFASPNLEQLQVGGGKALLSGEEVVCEEASAIAECFKRGFK
jgi:hypothetical protein